MTWYLIYLFTDAPVIVGMFATEAECLAALKAAVEDAGRNLPLVCEQ